MESQSSISTYLVKPQLRRPSHDRLMAWRIRWRLLTMAHPRLQSNLILILAGWLGLNLSLQFLSLPQQHLETTNALASAVDSASPTSNQIASLANAKPLRSLTSGPSGNPLPPGALAPDRTYANTYAWGNCTWYVASRRPIPAGWSNASSWYYHAVASGWKVGTTPAVGAVAWTIHPTTYLGHVSLVEQISADHTMVYVSEMNVRGLGIKSYRWAPANSFKYIY